MTEQMSLLDAIFHSGNLPTFIALTIGMLAGILVTFVTRSNGIASDFDSKLVDLEERKEHAIALLRELESQRGRIDPAAYEQQRTEQEHVAADALRARDGLLGRRRIVRAPITFLDERPLLRSLIWGTAIVLVFGAGWMIVSPSEIPPAGRNSAATPTTNDPELTVVYEQLRANPRDVDALVRGGSLLVERERLDEARSYIERALQLDPEHPGALIQYAGLLAADGKLGEALTRLDSLVTSHPNLPAAWLVRSRVAMQAGDAKKARESLETYVALTPARVTGEQIRAIPDSTTLREDE